MALATLDVTLDDWGRRLYALEQYVYGSSQNEFSEIIIDDGTNPPIVITPQPPVTPTGLTATPGSFYDVIYADIAWTAATTGEPANLFEIEVAKKVSGVYQTAMIEQTAGTNFRIQPLEPNTVYGVRVTPYSILGIPGTATAWLDFNSGIDTTIPVAPSGVVIARGATSVVVKFNPSTSIDVIGGQGYYTIEIDTALTFATTNKRSVNTTGTIFAFSDITSEGTWYARVAAVDSSGNQSAWVTSTAYTAGAIIDNMIVAGLDAAKITFGTMSGDRITTNTLDAASIKTSSITSANITLAGGAFKAGNPPTTGLLINSQGIKLYNGGVLQVSLDSSGSASFTGSISASQVSGTTITGGTITGAVFQTATSGARLVIDQSNTQRIKFYNSGGTQIASVGADTGAGANAYYVTLAAGGFMQLEETGDGFGGDLFLADLFAHNVQTSSGGKVQAAGTVFFGTDLRKGTSSSSTVVVDTSRKGWFTDLDASGNVTVLGYVSLNGGWVNIYPSGQIDNQKIHLFATGQITVQNDGWINTAMPTTTSGANVNVAFGTLSLVTSSGAGKSQVMDLHEKLDIKTLHEFRPRTWHSRWHEGDLGGFDDPDEVHFGFIAEEVEDIDRRLVQYPYGPDSDIKGINWNAVTALLVAEIQQLRKDVDHLMAA